MKPRTAYRGSVLLIPVAAVLTIVAAIGGLWLVALGAALVSISGLMNLRNARRRGIRWDGPRTFRELRDMERVRAQEEPR